MFLWHARMRIEGIALSTYSHLAVCVCERSAVRIGTHQRHGCPQQGTFNAWDRLPFIPSKNETNRDVLSGNFALSNFNSYNGIDTDDDSAYFLMRDNVHLYGHFLKSDYSGHDIEYSGSLGVFTGPSNQVSWLGDVSR